MHNVLIVGAGKIGSIIACLLAESGAFQVHLSDVEFSGADAQRLLKTIPDIKKVDLDATKPKDLQAYLKAHQIVAIVSSLPYFLNHHVAKVAKSAQVHYFDLTEDTTVTRTIKNIANGAKSAFVPQCGLAPGFISIAANSMMQDFHSCQQAKLRVGALPQHSSNALHYALTWSTDGMINEYDKPCYGIENGRHAIFSPLEGLETIQLDGCEYEAFHTSGGLGSLCELYADKIQSLNYKTIRYPGHCEKMHFLMHDLKLNQDRGTLKRILESAIPKTYQDMILIYISVQGIQNGELIERNYVKKIYPKIIHDIEWSAIQVSTGSGVCAVLDLVLNRETEFHGLVLQENFQLSDVLNNRFGEIYR